MSVKKINKSALIAEFIGTFSLAIAVLVSANGYLNPIPTPVVAGTTLGLLILTIGKISGAQVNPAITLGLLSLKKIRLSDSLAYIASQITGALSAFVVMNLLTDGTLPIGSAPLADYQTFFAEMLGAMIFGFGIAAAIRSKYEGVNKALTIGGSLTFGAMVASVASSGILNPALAFSMQLVNWSYILGPIVGMIIGMNIYAYAFSSKGKI